MKEAFLMKWKKWFLPPVLGVIAFLSGYHVANEINETKTETYIHTIAETHAIQVLTYEGTQSAEAYKKGDPHVAIALLEHNISWLNIFKNSELSFMSPKILAKDIAISHVRLSKVYERLGNMIERDAHLQKAVDEYRMSDSVITSEQLLQLVSKMDESILEE